MFKIIIIPKDNNAVWLIKSLGIKIIMMEAIVSLHSTAINRSQIVTINQKKDQERRPWNPT